MDLKAGKQELYAPSSCEAQLIALSRGVARAGCILPGCMPTTSSPLKVPRVCSLGTDRAHPGKNGRPHDDVSERPRNQVTKAQFVRSDRRALVHAGRRLRNHARATQCTLIASAIERASSPRRTIMAPHATAAASSSAPSVTTTRATTPTCHHHREQYVTSVTTTAPVGHLNEDQQCAWPCSR